MKSGASGMLSELKNIPRKEEAIVAGMGGVLIFSALTHVEIISTIPGIIMKAFELGIGISHTNMVGESNLNGLIIAGISPRASHIFANRANIGARKERSRWEIIEDMLTVLKEDGKAKKTRIMQRACLDWRNFQRYFQFLLEGGFIAEFNNSDIGGYELTDKGTELLKRLQVVGEMLHTNSLVIG